MAAFAVLTLTVALVALGVEHVTRSRARRQRARRRPRPLRASRRGRVPTRQARAELVVATFMGSSDNGWTISNQIERVQDALGIMVAERRHHSPCPGFNPFNW